ncbi:Sys1 protein [Saccharomycopsis crataegensis]|uniref:Sys1 protein n=1 Tax=Saccharomycopsis crataegensis TaxID=43959 RepID=A0AAV5QGV9_9ASCO|nr:Sys1 protein [Saccharomycopsis crataegensis]
MQRGYMKISSNVMNSELFKDTLSPSRIFAQIVLLQCTYYIIATLLFSFTASLFGYQFTFNWVFSWQLVDISNTLGLVLFFLWLLDTLLCVLFMTIIVGRSKLAWDFALTVHMINLFVVWLYSKEFPSSFWWWVLQITSSGILVFLGTYTTRWRELRQTFFDGLVDSELASNQRSSRTDDIEMQAMENHHNEETTN